MATANRWAMILAVALPLGPVLICADGSLEWEPLVVACCVALFNAGLVWLTPVLEAGRRKTQNENMLSFHEALVAAAEITGLPKPQWRLLHGTAVTSSPSAVVGRFRGLPVEVRGYNGGPEDPDSTRISMEMSSPCVEPPRTFRSLLRPRFSAEVRAFMRTAVARGSLDREGKKISLEVRCLLDDPKEIVTAINTLHTVAMMLAREASDESSC